MQNLRRKNVQMIGWGKWILLFIGCLVFSVSGRSGNSLSYEQHVLSALTDHYYLIYFMIPMFLFICFSVMEDDIELVILRFGGYFRYFIKKWMSMAGIVLNFILVQFAAIGLSGVGLTSGNNFNLSPNNVQTELFLVLGDLFVTPIACISVTIAYMFVGLCLTVMVYMWLAHFIPNSWAIKVMVVGYLLTAVSIKIPVVQNLPITGIHHLVILHHNFITRGRLWLTLATELVGISIILWTVKYGWRGRFQFKKKQGLANYYVRVLMTKKSLIILSSLIGMITIWKYISCDRVYSAEEWIYELFSGHSTGRMQSMKMLELLIMNGMPLYLLGIFLEQVMGEHSLFVTIRIEKKYKILQAILLSSMLFIGVYALVLIIVATGSSMILGFQIKMGTVKYLLGVISIRVLDIMVQYLVMLSLYCLTRKVTLSFLLVLASHIIGILPVRLAVYFPVGISSLSRMKYLQMVNTNALFIVCMVLVIAGSMQYVWLRFYGYKKLL